MTSGDTPPPPRRHRSLFLSDLHLGAPGCRAESLLAFLQANDADTIYLVGDTFDLWDPLFIVWGTAHDRILALLRARAAEGRRILLLAGNHDRALLTPAGRARPEVAGLATDVPRDLIHHAPDGRRYLVVHGDICDLRPLRFHICTRIGSRLDSFLRLLDRMLRPLRFRAGPGAQGPMELAVAALNALLYRGRSHEARLIRLARDRGCDGVISGHFHMAALHDDLGLRYANCGDWTDSCTALTEDAAGRLCLVGMETAPLGDPIPPLAPQPAPR